MLKVKTRGVPCKSAMLLFPNTPGSSIAEPSAASKTRDSIVMAATPDPAPTSSFMPLTAMEARDTVGQVVDSVLNSEDG